MMCVCLICLVCWMLMRCDLCLFNALFLLQIYLIKGRCLSSLFLYQFINHHQVRYESLLHYFYVSTFYHYYPCECYCSIMFYNLIYGIRILMIKFFSLNYEFSIDVLLNCVFSLIHFIIFAHLILWVYFC